jgi:hypothetical protein
MENIMKRPVHSVCYFYLYSEDEVAGFSETFITFYMLPVVIYRATA